MLSVVWSSVSVTGADAELRSPAGSDPRATFVNSNVVTCSGAGFPLTIQMGSPSNTTRVRCVRGRDGRDECRNRAARRRARSQHHDRRAERRHRRRHRKGRPGTTTSTRIRHSSRRRWWHRSTTSHRSTVAATSRPSRIGSSAITSRHHRRPERSPCEKAVIAPDWDPRVTAHRRRTRAVVNCDDGIPAHENVTVTFNLGGGRAGDRCHNSPAWPTERPAPWSSRTAARSPPARS